MDDLRKQTILEKLAARALALPVLERTLFAAASLPKHTVQANPSLARFISKARKVAGTRKTNKAFRNLPYPPKVQA